MLYTLVKSLLCIFSAVFSAVFSVTSYPCSFLIVLAIFLFAVVIYLISLRKISYGFKYYSLFKKHLITNWRLILTSYVLLLLIKFPVKFLFLELGILWLFPLFCGIFGIILFTSKSNLINKIYIPKTAKQLVLIGLTSTLISALFIYLF